MKFQIPYETRGAYDEDWCYDCERHKDNCVCEELCDHFRREAVSDAGMCVHVPSVSGPLPIPDNLTAKQRFHASVNHEIRRMMRDGNRRHEPESIAEANSMIPHVPDSFEDWLKQNGDSIEIGDYARV